MPDLAAASIDLIACDLPYGSTDNPWDSIIPLEPLFAQYRRIIKPRGAIVLTGLGLFSARLMLAAPDLYRYSLVWRKNSASNFLNAKKMPLRIHEDLLVFYKNLPTYNPQKTQAEITHRQIVRPGTVSTNYGGQKGRKSTTWTDDGTRYPTSVIEIDRVHFSKTVHPTEKPVELGEWIVRTYSNPGDLVLDNACGSGAFLLAAKNAGRHYLGMERDPAYYAIACERLSSSQDQHASTAPIT